MHKPLQAHKHMKRFERFLGNMSPAPFLTQIFPNPQYLLRDCDPYIVRYIQIILRDNSCARFIKFNKA